jgi:hypothetical protein
LRKSCVSTSLCTEIFSPSYSPSNSWMSPLMCSGMRRKSIPSYSLSLSSQLEDYRKPQEEVCTLDILCVSYDCFIVTSNPFIRVKYNDQRYRTSTVPKSLQPIWNESFIFPYHSPSMKAVLSVYDCVSFGRDTVIGNNLISFLRDTS